MKWCAGIAILLASCGAAVAQPAVLYAGQLDLDVKAGDTVHDCLSLGNQPPGGGQIATEDMVCLKPGPDGTGPSIEHYMRALSAKGFKQQPSNLQTPIFFFCRDQQMVAMTMMQPNVYATPDLEWVDADTGVVAKLEEHLKKAPLALIYQKDGPCTYL